MLGVLTDREMACDVPFARNGWLETNTHNYAKHSLHQLKLLIGNNLVPAQSNRSGGVQMASAKAFSLSANRRKAASEGAIFVS